MKDTRSVRELCWAPGNLYQVSSHLQNCPVPADAGVAGERACTLLRAEPLSPSPQPARGMAWLTPVGLANVPVGSRQPRAPS